METTASKKTFREIIQTEPLVLVDFFATWCGPCKAMSPILDELKGALGDKVRVLKVDVDRNQAAASAFQVRGVPTLLLFHNGKQVWRQSGVVPADHLKGLVRQYI